MTLPERDRRVCWHPYTQHATAPEPLPVVGARGAWLELAGGARLFDAISSWWCCLHGHGHPRLVDALARQAARLDHVLFAGCTHEPAVALAEELVRHAPPGLSRVFYSDDGSTAVEVALKAAFLSWKRRGAGGRTLFLALEGGYHGDTFGAMALGDPDPFFAECAPLLCRVERAPPTLDGLAALMRRHGREAAALLVEPLVQGAAGMRALPRGLLRAARELCDETGALLIVDEVMTGFGRTGTLFACEQEQVTPALLCLAKGLTGGMLPLAATLAREAIFEAFLDRDPARAFFHGHTFTANPLACAVALASLRLALEGEVPARFAAIGARIEEGIAPLRTRGMVRRVGGIVAVELADEAGGYLSPLGARLRAACRSAAPEVLLRPLGNVLYAMPPACATDEECDLVAAAMRRVVDSLA